MSLHMDASQWQYLHGKPGASGILKASPQDFKVTEILGYEPCGEGEHIYIWVRKEGLNTAYLAEQIAKFSRLPLRAVTYAGRKDKHALTEQWFSVHKPGNSDYDWGKLDVPGAQVLNAIRHNKKLRTGVLKGNRFSIRITQLSNTDELEDRISTVAQFGVPNYFGQQRFGSTRYHPHGGNLALAEKILKGEDIRNRNKRSMAISAMRSWLFNQMISQRIATNRFYQPMSGDLMRLAGSASFFCSEAPDDTIMQRLASRDIAISAPMWGAGALESRLSAQAFEMGLADQHKAVAQALADLGMKQERRAISLFPDNLHWDNQDDQLTIDFDLPAGAFATSVLRELLNVEQQEDSSE